nr:MAG TPA: lysozyme family protein [Caudoviricetes sp.]
MGKRTKLAGFRKNNYHERLLRSYNRLHSKRN